MQILYNFVTLGAQLKHKMSSSKIKPLNINSIIYFDIAIHILLIIILIFSLIPNSFTIVPMQLTKPFIGIHLLNEIFTSLHYILIGMSIMFISQSTIMISELKQGNIKNTTITKLLFYRWVILTINSAIPYIFNLKIPAIFIIISVITLFIFWYITLWSE